MIRRVVLSLFSFAVFSAFADAIYYAIYDDFSGSLTYTYSFSGSAADLYSIFFPDSSPFSVSPTCVNFPDGSFVGTIDDDEFDPFSFDGYIPSDPAYADFPFAPAVDPLSGGGSSGGGSPSGGGEGEGGFDPVGFFGGLPSMMSALASVVLGLFAIASGILLTFLVFRKVRYSTKRI